MRHYAYPPPNGIGVEIIARKHSSGKVAFQYGMYFFTMAATLIVPTDYLISFNISVGHNGVYLIHLSVHFSGGKRITHFRRTRK
jgi:hypothetical protein